MSSTYIYTNNNVHREFLWKYTDKTKLALRDIADKMRHSKEKVWCMTSEKADL